MPSIEEKVEYLIKQQLDKLKIKHYAKTEIINKGIDEALNKAPSKSGGEGKNLPDIKLFIETKELKQLPVMIEVKGSKGDLAKFTTNGEIDNFTKDKKPNYANIKKYALNGAIHYADAVTFYSDFSECLAIGINGYDTPTKDTKIEYAVYFVTNPQIYQKLGDFSDLSFLKSENLDEIIENCKLSAEQIEAKSKEIENAIEVRLKNLNETIHHTYGVAVQHRVEIVVGMIMAALGFSNIVKPLNSDELNGENTSNSNDGKKILNKIADFLDAKNLSKPKKDMILNELEKVFIHTNLWQSENGESKLKNIYKIVLDNVMPYLKNNRYHLDFTGQLFNVLNRYVDVPDGEKNDVVLTPRYVTELMARLCEVNKDSFVWDYALGSGGFLISAMKLMLEDAKKSIKSDTELKDKLFHIKQKQLLGVELRPDICLLAILNMILMGDGSSNIINANSLDKNKFDGNYQDENTPFPANVFLLNPPYSADGKGFVFVEKALKKMKNGKAAVLIQENAGAGQGLPYTAEILKHSTLLASIKMSDIFCGKAGVQTAVYVFSVGTPHDETKLVKFIDFSNDGYIRQNRKKSGLNVNLRDSDDAKGRYKEIVDIVLNRKKSTNYFNDCVIEDTISLDGKDWTYAQHKKIDTMPNLGDFKKTVSDYLAWEVSQILSKETPRSINFSNLQRLENEFKANGGEFREFKLNELFESSNGDFDIQKTHINGKGHYVVSSGEQNLGIIGKTDIKAKIFDANTITIDMFGNAYFRPYEYKMVTHARVFSLKFTKGNLNPKLGLYFVSKLFFLPQIYSYSDMASWNKIQNLEINLPFINGEIAFDFIEKFIAELEAERVAELEAYLAATGLKDYKLTTTEQTALDIFANYERERERERESKFRHAA
ncbi:MULTISPECIES: N-6 DNA methylase [unclassified Campylobacter]|uniref:N-6 DNA methylase n=2 Tax=unclassified Campylobacter TaxID=2593542 RepID=UPI0022E9AB3B|nr:MULTISPECIES: N-6 DNA methylase [unclassified Campylobacter]MDA3044481.1 N-6 DNA methylase [Campylobacter sp. JMF_07 ED4]MDA3063396.1 N-6 DNA methylase [Campylobacter sp. JMF_11 EL3]MDA3074478.1 N-6 DNA methylase [Campylobacter sp. JMF_05 ED3]